MSHRIDYDAVAQQYDSHPYRGKEIDPELVSFAEERGVQKLRILDVACGTGNQLIANRDRYPEMEMTGCDLSRGMLEVARSKSAEIAWVHADLKALPFEGGSFDYVTCQYAFHHVTDKLRGLEEICRVTAPGGRFVMKNISPHDMSDNLVFEAFPQALTQDLIDYMPPQEIVRGLKAVGFKEVQISLDTVVFDTTLERFLQSVSDQQSSSELALLSDRDYQSGLAKIRAQIDTLGAQIPLSDKVVLLTITADQ